MLVALTTNKNVMTQYFVANTDHLYILIKLYKATIQMNRQAVLGR